MNVLQTMTRMEILLEIYIILNNDAMDGIFYWNQNLRDYSNDRK